MTLRLSFVSLFILMLGTTGPATAQTFAPSDISNLILWLDATDLDGDGTQEGLAEGGLANGNKVATWNDKSGNNHHASASESGVALDIFQPTYITSHVQTGMPAVVFNDDVFNGSGSDLLTVASAFNLSPGPGEGFTAFVTVGYDNNGDTADVFFEKRLGGGSFCCGYLFFEESRTANSTSNGVAGDTLAAQVNDDTAIIGLNSPTENTPEMPAVLDDGIVKVLSTVWDRNPHDGDEAMVNFGVNSVANLVAAPDTGIPVTSGQVPPGDSFGPRDMWIGRSDMIASSALANGAISEILIYKKELSSTEQQDVISYLDGKYNVLNPPELPRVWNQGGSSTWADNTHWNGGDFPNSNADDTTFGDTIAFNATVTVDNLGVTARSLTFQNASQYTIAGSGTVTLASDTGTAAINVIDSDTNPGTAETHEFQIRAILADPTTITTESGTTLNFNNELNLNGASHIKDGPGTMNINNRLTTAGGDITVNGGTLGGHGSVGGNVTNTAGSVAPGSSPGILTIDGNYTQGASGSIALQIGGLVPGDDHDKLIVTGTADLNGSVAVELTGGYTPSANDTFDVLDFSAFVDSGYTFDFSAAMGVGAWDTVDFETDGTLCFGACVGVPMFTDFDDSGFWDLPDLNLVLFSWQQNEASLPGEWVNQRPATVGLDSLNLVLFNWQQASSLAVVPEPATLCLLLFGLAYVEKLRRTTRE
jgi:hypothetical protein